MEITDKIDKLLLSEARTSLRTIKDLVSILKGADFGMSASGGNGYAYVKDNQLIIHDPHYYQPSNTDLHNKVEAWKSGTYAKYFKEEYGVTFDNVRGMVVSDGRKYKGMFGYIQVSMDVKFSGKTAK